MTDTALIVHGQVTEEAVLAVIGGEPVDRVANHAGVPSGYLVAAVEAYRSAGRSALDTRSSDGDWHQVHIRFADWETAEHVVATSLGPYLEEARTGGLIDAWWFLRKHPCWRVRCRRGPEATNADVEAGVAAAVNAAGREVIERWWPGRYEPEGFAFGGPHGIRIAHRLFHTDSLGVLDYLRHQPSARAEVPGRRELSLILVSTMLRYANLDQPEQADVWHRVVQARPLASPPPPERLEAMAPNIRHLIHLDTASPTGLFGQGGDLAFAAPWVAEFAEVGRELAEADRSGMLEPGLRSILAKHVIFHWNRIGLPARTQAILARAARDTVLEAKQVLVGRAR